MLASLSPPSSSLSPASLLQSTRHSPPHTPPQTQTTDQSSPEPSPAHSDDSAYYQTSFIYEQNSQGEIVRLPNWKTHRKTSSPPTPVDALPPVELKPPSPSPTPAPPPRPSSLSRSESLPIVEPSTAPRSFQRVTSGPVVTPASSSSRGSFAPLSTGTARKFGGARRVKVDDLQSSSSTLPSATVDEKEHARSARPIVPLRPRAMIPKKSGIDKILEEGAVTESDDALDAPSRSTNRPRRSASLSDASGAGYLDEHVPYQRPGTSLGVSSKGARRITIEEKIRKEREIALMEGYAMREAEEAAEAARARHSPSPTHVSSHSRPTHARKESDTLRNANLALGSPTAVEHPRLSPTPRASSSAPYPPQPLRHRRSPTAPEAPTSSDDIGPVGPAPVVGKTWAAGEGRERNSDGAHADPVGRAKSLPGLDRAPPKSTPAAPAPVSLKSHASQPALAHTPIAPAPDVKSRNMVVNKKAYARLDLIGKGGSSRVYRVMNGTNEIYAIKRVALDKTDSETMSGYMNEIALLKRLEGNSRIIRLIDSELRPGPGGQKGHLLLVMECGEIDLARLLQEQQKEPLDLVWISYYWKQMLQAVHVIHEEKIVHSDLKPANFVLVKGQLKLIDFGIANAIANDTTNIQRDHQIGTVNYMSPEAIELPDGMRRLKVGRPSDVWSLGCILYQMVYGHPPFQHLSVYMKMKAIPDPNHVIEFPEFATPSVPAKDASPRQLDHLKIRVPETAIATMKACLVRNPKERATIPDLLDEDWLTMRKPPVQQVPMPLREDETVINPHFMLQLLEYGIKLGKGEKGKEGEISEEVLMIEAERLVRELQSVHDART